MGQWARLHRMFIVYRPNPIVSASKMAFFWKFSFLCSFFFLRWNLDSCKFVKLLNCKWVNGHDCIGDSSFFSQIPSFLPPKWHFFLKIFVLVLNFLFFCVKIQIRTNWCNFSIGNGSTDRTLYEVHRFSAKFHCFGLQNGIFLKIFISVVVFFSP